MLSALVITLCSVVLVGLGMGALWRSARPTNARRQLRAMQAQRLAEQRIAAITTDTLVAMREAMRNTGRRTQR